MSSQTPNIGLTLTPSSEGAKFFKDWVDENTGTADSSNLNKIDRAFGELKDKDTEQKEILDNHVSSLSLHTSSSEKEIWNNKAESDLTNVDNAVFKAKAEAAGAATSWDNLEGKPPAFPPSSHSHTVNDVTNLDAALATKADLVNNKVPLSQLPDMDYDPAGSAAEVQANLDAHKGDTNNPHGMTAEKVGAAPANHTHAAGNIAGLDEALAGKLDSVEKGAANGVAPLGADGKVPDGYLNAQGGLVAQEAAPENRKLGWIDTGNGNILKFYNGTDWIAVNAVWG